ncbi:MULTISPECIES: hypothetical protein [Pseudomonas]|uniref:Uncharacterized protein n=1 Tax=Pseudomonas cucumis TaxID=2954082 RepID=A0ABY9ETT9_9PSED|nr:MULTISPECIES: hypothetical protein [Pseudomonas]MDR8368185.1 hypothetical protein [Pseudomonas sp. JL3]URM29732.1 hypothetical protein LLY42_09215 [Pseudomonas frederiksbergensis]WLG84135.1 hypothetical protein PSH97_24115 [Pseudomonas cucumis]WLG89705.1 hypothetical protein PSH72_24755 [Pseudomonas cucumis]
MGGVLVGVLAAVRRAHQIQDLIIVVLPVCPVQAQSTLGFFRITSGNNKIGMTGLTGWADLVDLYVLWQTKKNRPSLAGFFIAAV